MTTLVNILTSVLYGARYSPEEWKKILKDVPHKKVLKRIVYTLPDGKIAISTAFPNVWVTAQLKNGAYNYRLLFIRNKLQLAPKEIEHLIKQCRGQSHDSTDPTSN